MRINDSLEIDESELKERFVRSSGPGGQNVNKVSTAVELRFDFANNVTIPAHARGRLKRLAGRRLTNDGEIVIQADRFRSQEQNREDARERLKEMIAEALRAPPVRIYTKPTPGARKRRLKDKTERSDVKKLRSRKFDLD